MPRRLGRGHGVDDDPVATMSFSDTEVEEMERAFKIIDEGRTGTLNSSQLAFYLYALGLNLTPEQVAALPESADLSAAKAAYSANKSPGYGEAELVGLFATWDKTGSGEISLANVTKEMPGIPALTAAELAILKEEAKISGDSFKYEEFARSMAAMQVMRTGFA